MANEDKLLEYNEHGFLSNVLAAEEHLAESPTPDFSHMWCYDKHMRLGLDHHLKEAIQHATVAAPEKAESYRELYGEYVDLIGHPDLERTRELRNTFRELSGDPTVGACKGSVCALDVSKDMFKKNDVLNAHTIEGTRSLSQSGFQVNTEGDFVDWKPVLSVGAGSAAGGVGGVLVDKYVTGQTSNIGNADIVSGVLGVAGLMAGPLLLKGKNPSIQYALFGFGSFFVGKVVEKTVNYYMNQPVLGGARYGGAGYAPPVAAAFAGNGVIKARY